MSSHTSDHASHMERIAQALGKVTAESDNFMSGDLEARHRLVSRAGELVSAAETPFESLLWNIWALPTRIVAARIAVDLKIFETVMCDGGRPKSTEELATPTGASPTLVKRIAKACVSMNMLDEHGPGLYVPNDLTKLMSKPEYAAGVIFNFDMNQSLFSHMPAYLRNTKFQNPDDPLNGPFQYANQSGSMFTWLADHPEVFHAFHLYLRTLRTYRPSWMDMYPVQKHLVEGLNVDGDASAFVDIGGSTGQMLEEFRDRVPEYKGRLVLQDTSDVISAAAAGLGNDTRIELQVHDFFAPQPIKGARAYFMHFILHDWPDDRCREILGHLRDAMEPGYSKILIGECIVADQKAAWQHVALDLFMMAQVSSHERTEGEWRTLLESCGLKIAGIYTKGEGNEGLIEVVV
ncbi:S-adenosyl-L-methionine-dependent methyltransferase [Annulohypoxylon truncatum]|uniref:S-adenosyl-L-methionine-dependent methyltransferase n=1 Tax=Annulohypoxylon truncatum TaxID=327061 RepID=UPI002007EE25|nr:S-adenosyl-L-methionine-dependent methyltransferase [Annulohypoxylon truncatum]KAI1204465.1 S-adenosyl-L-methionine-dependent methyltransferase [Annulohypoxylon truncatum]